MLDMTRSAYPYQWSAEGAVTWPAQTAPAHQGWAASIGVHQGDLMSRGDCDLMDGLADFAACADVARYWTNLGYFLWYANAIAPDGTVHQIAVGAPYDDGRGFSLSSGDLTAIHTEHWQIARGLLTLVRLGLRSQKEMERIIISDLRAVRSAALEACAVLAEDIGLKEHDKAHDPQEDNSDVTGEKIAAAIRRMVTR